MFKLKNGKGLRVPAKASLFYSLAGALAKGTGLLFTPIFTRVMAAEEYGRYTLYITTLALMSVVCTAPVTGSMMYKGYGEFDGERRSFTAAAMGLAFCTVPAVCLLALALRKTLGISIGFVPLLLFQLILDVGTAAMYAELRYAYSYGRAATLTVISALATPMVSLLIMHVSNGAYARIFGLLLVSVAVALPFIARCVRTGLYRGDMWKFALRYSAPMLPGALAASVIAQADKLIVSAYMGAEALAPYAVAHSIGVGLTFITASLGSALHPWMMRKLRAGEYERVGDTVSRIYSSLGALTVILTALAPEALSLLTPESYSVALPAIFPIALATLPSFLLSVGSVAAVYAGKPYYSSVGLGAGAAVNVLANILAVPRLSYLGAGFSLLLSYAVAAGVSYLLPAGRRVLRDMKLGNIARTSLSTASMAVIVTFFYGSLPARILLLIIPVGALIYSAVGMREYVTEST